MSFKIRTTVPEKTDKRYMHKSAGGDYLGLKGSPAYYNGSALSNCVAYAFGRRQEIEKDLVNDEHTLVGIPKGRSIYSPTSAYLWYGIGKEVDGYDRSTNIPEVGSVCVWKNNSKNTGHVAIVEDIAKNKKDWIKITESGMGSKNEKTGLVEGGYCWRSVLIYPRYCKITNYDVAKNKYNTTIHFNYKFKNGVIYKTGNTFLGYIYPPVKKDLKPVSSIDELKVGDVVKYKELTRYVLAINLDKDKPYLIGIPASENTKKKVTGWYKREQLTKV